MEDWGAIPEDPPGFRRGRFWYSAKPMRWLAPTVFLALLAACSVTTTGAPCDSDLNCPTGQGCGSDGKCGAAALECPGHTTDGECTPGRSCSAGQLVTCTAGSGVCSTGPVTTSCPTHQQCASSGSAASCECFPTLCSSATSSFCSAGGQLVSCAQDLSSAKGCWYEASSAACSDPGAACVEAGGSAACACPTVNACTQLDATQCSVGGGQVLRCKPVVNGSACLSWQTETACSDPGTTCTETGGTAACSCPTANACSPLDATTCSATGNQVLRCQPVVTGSACLTWQGGTNCATSSLVCSAGACACPANPGPVFHADAAGGSDAGAIPAPTGAAAPPQCRYRSLTAALASASVLGAGATAKAAGWSAALPGGVMLFSEPGPLSIGAGVTLATDDASPTTTHYAVTTAAPLTGPFLSIGPGGSLSGYEIRNGASTGGGVQTACPAPADSAAVSMWTVRIAAASGGAPVVRFGSGVHVTGYCPATMANVTVDGAATGILVESAPLVESTAAAAHVTGSTVAGVSVVEGRISFTGGLVDLNAEGVSIGATGAGAPSFSATGTTFSSNAGDAIYVARGTLFSDGCPYVNNGTHVHAQPVGGAAVNVTVQNSTGAAKMTGATNSAFRLLAMGSGSTLTLTGNEIVGNSSTQDYLVGSGQRRGGGMVFTAPFPGLVVFRGNSTSGNNWDQVLVASSTGSLDLRGGSACNSSTPSDKNTFKCYDAANQGVGLYSNGATVVADWNRWSNQPAVVTIDFAGTGVSGENAACALDRVCP